MISKQNTDILTAVESVGGEREIGETTDHEGQRRLVANYLKRHDWIIQTEYTIENRRIDLVAWYRYDDIILIVEVKTDLPSELVTAIGQLMTAKALIKNRYPSHEIHTALAVPFPMERRGSTFIHVCVDSGIFVILNYGDGKLMFSRSNTIPHSFDVYMAYKLWKVINKKLPKKLENILEELGEKRREIFESLILEEVVL